MAHPTIPKLLIEGIQSVTPRQVTDPRLTCKVSIENDLYSKGVLQSRMQMVLYYRKQKDEDSGWIHGGWFRETLGKALIERPILAGRLRRDKEGGIEIVANDSGVRLVEAQVFLSMEEYFEVKDKDRIDEELVYWNDVDEANPKFSPLFYVQVTNFQCGGYSIGITYSLLLCDPFSMTNFIKRWANIHNTIVSHSEVLKIPFFYLPYLKKAAYAPSTSLTCKPSKKSTKTIMFEIVSEKSEKLSESEFCKSIALLCIEEGEAKFGEKMTSNFTLIIRKSFREVKVENCSKGEAGFGFGLNSCDVRSLGWEELRADEIFIEDTAPVCVSQWVVLGVEKGLVVVTVPSSEGEVGVRVQLVFV